MPGFVEGATIVVAVLVLIVIGIGLLGAYLEAEENRRAKKEFFEIRPRTELLIAKVRAMVQNPETSRDTKEMFEMVEQEVGDIFELTEKSKEPWVLVVSCLALIHQSLRIIEELLNREQRKRGVSQNPPVQEV